MARVIPRLVGYIETFRRGKDYMASDNNDPRPPCAHAQFDVGSTDDSLARMVQAGAEFGDIYRVHAPGHNSDTWVVADPDTIKRVLVSNHRNYTIGRGAGSRADCWSATASSSVKARSGSVSIG